MKNYLVKSLYSLRSTFWHFNDRRYEFDLKDNYQKMHEVSLDSFRKNLLGDWEYRFYGGDLMRINQAFEQTFWEIYELWHRESCNILYTDVDTVAINPVDPWTEVKFCQLFNYTNTRGAFAESNKHNLAFDHFFNAGVRYFPSTMLEETWEIGARLARNWDHAQYNSEQIVLNQMMWSQGVTLDQVLKPELAYQAHLLPDSTVDEQDLWNGCRLRDAKIVHVHGSRSSNVGLKLMQQLVNKEIT